MNDPVTTLALLKGDLAELLRQEPNSYQKQGDLKTKISDLEKAIAAAPPPPQVLSLEQLVRDQAAAIALLQAQLASKSGVTSAVAAAAPAAPVASKPFPPAP